MSTVRPRSPTLTGLWPRASSPHASGSQEVMSTHSLPVPDLHAFTTWSGLPQAASGR